MRDKTSAFNQSEISVKVDGDTHVFNAVESLDLTDVDFIESIRNHAQEYHRWRVLRDRIKKKLRSIRLKYEVRYAEIYFRHFTIAENTYNFVSNKVIEGSMIIAGNGELEAMRNKINKNEDKLDKLNSIVYALEHKKAMLVILSNAV